MLRNPTKRDYFNITVFYLAPSFFWAVMLVVLLQKRIEEFVSGNKQQEAAMFVIIAAGGIASIISQIVIGAISDRHRGEHGRRRPFMIAGTILSIPFIWFFALAGDFSMLVLSFVVLQIVVNIASGPYQALIPDMIPPERHGIASGYMGLWQLVGQAGGFTIAALLFSGVFGMGGVRALYVLFSLLFLALMAVTVKGVKETPYAGERISKRRAMLAIFRTDLRNNPAFVWVLISRFMINVGFYIALLNLNWYLQHALKVNKAEMYALILGLLVTFTGLLGTFPAGQLADRISKKTVIYGTCAICTVAAVVFWLAPNLAWALTAAAVFGIGFGAFAAVDWALACNVLPRGDAAKFLGIWTFSFVFPQIAAALVGALVLLAFQSRGEAYAYRAVFASIIPFMLLGTLSVSRVRERAVKNVERRM